MWGCYGKLDRRNEHFQNGDGCCPDGGGRVKTDEREIVKEDRQRERVQWCVVVSTITPFMPTCMVLPFTEDMVCIYMYVHVHD